MNLSVVRQELLPHLQAIESAIGNPSEGLPEDVFLFLTRVTPMINVDLLIQNEAHQTLFTWRDDGYNLPGWHIPGGIIRYKETAADRICAVARLELGTRVAFDPMPLTVREVIRPSFKNRAHFVSLLFRCSLTAPPDPAMAFLEGSPSPGEWAWHYGCPDNIIEVHRMHSSFF
jgi:hypothetical protein